MRLNQRKRVFADWKIQGGLCLRVSAYWLTCQAMLVLTAFAINLLGGGNGEILWSYLLPACVSSLLVLPIALLDLLVFSNRFAGPWHRFRRNFDQLADGQAVHPLHFRPKDFCHDLSDNFNRLREQLASADHEPDSLFDEPELRSENTDVMAVN
ncbi:MAG: hypothetical protein ACR2NP_16140 [Pirellulaceae bacterium]